MPHPQSAPAVAPDEVVAATRATVEDDLAPSADHLVVEPVATGPVLTKWHYRMDLERHRAETERLRVLVEFLARPIHAHGGTEPDPDIVTAYNLAVEAALKGVRRGACS